MSDLRRLGELQGEGVRLGMLPRVALKWAREEFLRRYEREPESGESARDIARRKRPREVRAKTISIKRLSKREIAMRRLENTDLHELPVRPRTRLACIQDPERPCPFVSCKYHLYLDVSERTGAIKLNFPDLEVWEMTETCVLDVAARGGLTLEAAAVAMNLTRQRIQQIENKAKRLCGLSDDLREYGGAA